MGIVVALDVHRNQITYKALDQETGELRRGRISPAARAEVRAWLGHRQSHQHAESEQRPECQLLGLPSREVEPDQAEECRDEPHPAPPVREIGP
jgi:ferric-dicitrate binding protein FerR (iron transport regulator)